MCHLFAEFSENRLRNPANKQKNKQTNADEIITLSNMAAGD